MKSPTHASSPAWIALCLALTAPAMAAERVFTPADIIDWEPHSFTGETDYKLVTVDGRSAVRARCDGGTASGLFLRESIDLAETPILEWTWRVEGVYPGIDETEKAGDDYPARLYVVDEHTLLRWRTRALNYVWSSGRDAGTDWPNAYASRARMIAVDAGAPGDDGAWRTHRRDLREDFRTFHDRVPETVDALAIMTDCDDAGQSTVAYYGEIRLLEAQ